jgi:hypothetical protein
MTRSTAKLGAAMARRGCTFVTFLGEIAMIGNRLFVGIVSLMLFGFACLHQGLATEHIEHTEYTEYNIGFVDGYEEAFPAAPKVPKPPKPNPRRNSYLYGFSAGFDMGFFDRRSQEIRSMM